MNKILENFLNREVYSVFKEKLNQKHTLEIQINGNCNLSCEYCYCTKFGSIIFPNESEKTILKNLEILLNWLKENNMNPRIDIFSGEPIIQKVGRKVLERVVDWHIENKLDGFIVIPTNGTFVDNPKLLEWTENIIKKSKDNNIKLLLSFSIDGKFTEKYRPLKNGTRLEDFYDKVFDFVSKHEGCGIHPMIYSNAIDNWVENFDWFMEMINKYHIPVTSFYLLTVRNYNWSKEQVEKLYLLMRHITKYISGWMVENKIDAKDFVIKHFFNIGSFLSRLNRGMGCSIQTSLQVRLSDLSVSPCHRLGYPEFKSFSFDVKNNKIVGTIPHNVVTYMAVQSTDRKTLP